MTEKTELFGAESRGARLARIALSLLLCTHFTLEYISNRPFLSLSAYAAGEVKTPYQYRILPMLAMRASAHAGVLAKVARRLPVGDHSTNFLVMALLAFAGMLGAVWFTRGTLRALTGDASVGRWMCLLVVVMSYFNLAPTWGLNYTLPYDVPSLAFFAGGLWLIVTRRMVWLYPWFILATFNRETTCFLIVFYVVWTELRTRGKAGSRWTVAIHALALAVLWVAIKIYLAHVFRGNTTEEGGGLFASHLVKNLKTLCEPQQWPVLLSVCGFTLPLLWLGRRWLRDRAYAGAMIVVMALWFVGMTLVGVLVEIRVFAEWAALVTPALGLIVVHRFRPNTRLSEAGGRG